MTGPSGSGTSPVPGPADDPAVPLETAARWQQGEGRLYPAVTTRPDLYQRVVQLVRLTVDRLRGLGPSTGALLAASQRGPEFVAEVLAENGLSGYELDLELVAHAALAMRHREVAAEQAARGRLRLLAEGHRAGRSWVVLEERGVPAGDPFLPYTRLEAEVATGRALLVTASPDEEFRSVVHAVTPMRLDLDTGAVEDDADGPEATTHATSTAREEHAAALREQLSGS